MNLAEFPIAVVAEAAQPGQLTLRFSDSIKDQSTGETIDRSVTVHGTEEWGLPAAQDDEVMFGLLQLCYIANWPKRIRFTRYQLCKLLRWSIGGASYRRIYQALHRLSTTNYNYRYAWRDKTNQEWIPSQVFSYIQGLKIHEADKPTDSGLCEVTWSDDFFKSLEAGNLKGIDFDLFVSLKRPISKRLYRFLDKRFGAGFRMVTYDLRTLAFEKVGISRQYKDAAQIKRPLLPAIRELEDAKYIATIPTKERFQKVSKGLWNVIFTRYSTKPPKMDPKPGRGIEQDLVRLGISPSEARKFASEYSEDYLERKIDEFSYREAKQNPAGLLAASIRDDFPPPENYQSPEIRRRNEEARELRKAARANSERERLQKRQALAELESRQDEAARAFLHEISEEELSTLKHMAKQRSPTTNPSDRVIEIMLLNLVKAELRKNGRLPD